MTDAATLLDRLRSDPSHLEALVDLTLDELLATRARDLVDPAVHAAQLAAGLRASAQSPGLRPWIQRELEAVSARIQPRERPLREYLPPALPAALAGAVRRPFTPGRELVRAALNHAAMRGMMRSVLQTTLLDFARKLWSAVPDTSWIPGAGIRSKLVGVAKGVASAVGSDSMLEDKVRTFVDGALSTALDMVVERASDPRFAGEMGQWRADMVPALLSQPQSRFVAEQRKLVPADLAADAHHILTAVAEWPELEAQIAAHLGELVDALGERTLGEFLDGSGLVDAWRPQVKARLVAEARRRVASDGFARWLERLCAGAPSATS